MPQVGVRDVFLEINRQFNEDIGELAAATTSGPGPSAALIGRVRDTAAAAHARLVSLDPGDALIAANTAKVITHLDLFLTTLDAAAQAPMLTKKLLEHLLEEQVEITTLVASAANPILGSAAAAAAITPPAGAGSGAPTPEPLGGGRSPLTVGSLIGR